VGVLGFIGSTLAYRALIRTYSVSVYGKSDLKLSNKLQINKAKDVRRFALV
jgi:hypothetical protein